MQEAFLHFVWKNQYFNKSNLVTVSGASVSIQKIGFHNHLAGPDFKEAQLTIDQMQWAGSVEIHINSSDWHNHKHSNDPNYGNVILHVVYEYDKEVLNPSGKPIPTIALKGLIKPKLIDRYQLMLKNTDKIPCGTQLKSVKVVTRLSMLEKTLINRLEKKSKAVNELLLENNYSWEETAYQWLAKGFGFKVNAENMLRLARTVPSKFLRKHSQLYQYEALLFGASGLLNIDVVDEYPQQLKKEYLYLKAKYDIQESITYNQWNFSGVRPSNFPTIRIAQFAAMLCEFQNLFSLFTEFTEPKSLIDKLIMRQPDYWIDHVVIDKKSKMITGPMTKQAKVNLLINTTVPLLVAYAKHQDKYEYMEKAMNLLMALPKESNRITALWTEHGWNVSSAFDSQGLIELYNTFCSGNRCIDCNIGAELVSR
ncbi:hypothetical protein BFP71_11445 [Roseivirga misakiensis]|uniref:DUF2851 domain-containing protein n=1 Tax=Roseivirga misakiensis TaxID=1563681 RepID=A0A1E5T2F2_9BACT|nr:hypothetical protein BFP71_11445 [Roseivirga misakiensis]